MRKRKGMAVIAAIVMTAVMSLGGSLAATSVGMSDGAAAVTVNQTVVGFAGHEWWVIGDAEDGVYTQLDSVTLLAKNFDFEDTIFNSNYDNRYKGSILQKKMDDIASNLPDKELEKINKRTLSEGTDGIKGENVAAQQLWPLSGDEHEDIGIGMDYVRKYDKDYWLRSYSHSNAGSALSAPAAGHPIVNDDYVVDSMAARPALNLNVSSVIFTSDAGQTGKAAATAGGGLVSVTAPDTTGDGNKIKYTFKDDSLKLGNASVSKIEANKVTVAYAEATAGKTLSVIAKEKGGPVKFYGKLSSSTAKEGVGSFVVPDDFSFSKYDLEVFVEEINGANASDFASMPQALSIDSTKIKQVAVTEGSGGGSYTVGAEVKLKANAADTGKRFKGWKISPEVTPTQDTSFTDETITFTMPDTDVTATVEYEDVYTVTVNNGSISGGIEEYAEGEQVMLTANQPDPGKYFKGWNISPAVTLTEGTNTSSIIKFDMPAHAVTATAEYEDMIVYPIKDGGNTGWTQGDQGGLIITSEGEHRKFTDVSVDGAVLDRQHYTVESGSTIVTLKTSYLSTLSVGEHVMRIHFTDGYTETRFSIQAAQTDKPAPPTTDPGEPTSPVNPPVQPGEPNPPVQGGTTAATAGTSPKTGDDSRLWLAVGGMTAAGAIAFMLRKKASNSR